MIHCETCGIVPVPEKDLPVKLPDDVSFDKPGNPLDRHPTWKHVTCPQCGGPATRETDTMDTFVDFVLVLRALLLAAVAASRPTPTPSAIGCRSINISAASSTRSCICSMRASSPAPCTRPVTSPLDEPFKGLFTQGMVTHETYKDAHGKWVLPEEVSRSDGKAVHAKTGEPITIGAVESMSKSKKNVVDPDDIIAAYGADTARWFMLSDTPPERDIEWTASGVEGAHRFLQRVWRLVREAAAKGAPPEPPTPSEFGPEAEALRRAAHRGAGRGDGRHREAPLQ